MIYDIITIGTATIDTFLDINNVCYKKDAKKKVSYYCFSLGSKVPVSNMQECIGGNAVNTAVAFRRLQLKTAIVTSLGKSKQSKNVINKLKKERVGVNFIKINQRSDVNLSYILDWHKDKTDRVVLSYHRPKSFSKIKWPQTNWIYVTSLGEHAKQVFNQIPKRPCIAFNPGGREISKGLKFLSPILKRTEILIVNKEEAGRILGVKTGRKLKVAFLVNNLLKLGVRVVVLTCGARGAFAKSISDKNTVRVPRGSATVKEVTGAGDAFASGFVAGYIKKQKLKMCLKWGVLNASSCIEQIGAQNGLLRYRKIKQAC